MECLLDYSCVWSVESGLWQRGELAHRNPLFCVFVFQRGENCRGESLLFHMKEGCVWSSCCGSQCVQHSACVCIPGWLIRGVCL